MIEITKLKINKNRGRFGYAPALPLIDGGVIANLYSKWLLCKMVWQISRTRHYSKQAYLKDCTHIGILAGLVESDWVEQEDGRIVHKRNLEKG